VAAVLAEEAWVLCFDEFAVTDIADAMILGRLFTALFAHGVVVVATSNVEPDRLYEGGLNRSLFLPFIELLQERMEVVRSMPARISAWRSSPAARSSIRPRTRARAALDPRLQAPHGPRAGEPVRLTVKGHAVEVPQAAAGVARFAFEDLCAKPLGAADYLALAQRFPHHHPGEHPQDGLRAAATRPSASSPSSTPSTIPT
jgi:cell division protein ZapE